MLLQVRYFIAGCSRRTRRSGRLADAGRIPGRRRFHPSISPTISSCRSSPASGPAGSTAPATTRPATCSPSWTTTDAHRHRVAGMAHGRGRLQELREPGRPRSSPRSTPATPVRSVTGSRRDSNWRRCRPAASTDRRSSPATPIRRCICWPSHPCRARGCSARSSTSSRGRSCTPTPRCSPAHRVAHASWNYRMAGCDSDDRQVRVSYHLNRLQRIGSATDYLVTLNDGDGVMPAAILAEMTYAHPTYTLQSVAAQDQLGSLNDGRIAFAGAWQGWGFHEDGCCSGVRAAESLGVTGSAPAGPATPSRPRRPSRRHRPSIAATTLGASPPHGRGATAAFGTAARTGWSTRRLAPDCRPAPAAGPVRAADHLGSPTSALAQNIRSCWRARPGRRPDPAADQPAFVGHMFNPLSLYYCLRRQARRCRRELNGGGRRGAQHLRRPARLPAPARRIGSGPGRQAVLRLPVPADGRPLPMRTPVPACGCRCRSRCRSDGAHPVRRHADRHRAPAHHVGARAELATAGWRSWRTSALIRWQGLRLWLRGVPVQPRPGDAGGDETAR